MDFKKYFQSNLIKSFEHYFAESCRSRHRSDADLIYFVSLLFFSGHRKLCAFADDPSAGMEQFTPLVELMASL